MYARDTKLVQNSQNNRGSFVPKILRSDSTKSIYSPIDQNLLLQRALGNQAYGNMIQAKLKIGQPNDKYEQEADRVAEQVMRMPDTEVSGISKSPETVQRKCAACASGQGLCPKCEEEERIQRTPLASTITPLVQRQIVISDEEEEEEEFLQTRATPGSAPSVTPHIAANINAMRGGGQPLPQSVRAFF